MEDNLNYTQKHVNFEELGTTSLDQLDGLGIKGFAFSSMKAAFSFFIHFVQLRGRVEEGRRFFREHE